MCRFECGHKSPRTTIRERPGRLPLLVVLALCLTGIGRGQLNCLKKGNPGASRGARWRQGCVGWGTQHQGSQHTGSVLPPQKHVLGSNCTISSRWAGVCEASAFPVWCCPLVPGPARASNRGLCAYLPSEWLASELPPAGPVVSLTLSEIQVGVFKCQLLVSNYTSNKIPLELTENVQIYLLVLVGLVCVCVCFVYSLPSILL